MTFNEKKPFGPGMSGWRVLSLCEWLSVRRSARSARTAGRGPFAGQILLDLSLKRMDSLVDNRLGRPQWKSLRCGQLGSKPTTLAASSKMVALWETIHEDAALWLIVISDCRQSFGQTGKNHNLLPGRCDIQRYQVIVNGWIQTGFLFTV